MNTKHNFIVKEKDHKKRVDLIVVSNYSNYSRSKINKIIKSSVWINTVLSGISLDEILAIPLATFISFKTT